MNINDPFLIEAYKEVDALTPGSLPIYAEPKPVYTESKTVYIKSKPSTTFGWRYIESEHAWIHYIGRIITDEYVKDQGFPKV